VSLGLEKISPPQDGGEGRKTNNQNSGAGHLERKGNTDEKIIKFSLAVAAILALNAARFRRPACAFKQSDPWSVASEHCADGTKSVSLH